MRSVGRLLTETQSRANGPLSGKGGFWCEWKRKERNMQALSRTEAWKRGRREGENNSTEQSFPQHHQLTDQARSTKSGSDHCRHSVDLKSCYLLHSFDVLMSYDWACVHFFQSWSCVLLPAAFKTLSHIRYGSQHLVIIMAMLTLECGKCHAYGSGKRDSKQMMEVAGSLYMVQQYEKCFGM